MKILFALLFTLVCGPLRAVDANPFFAMNTIARGGPAEVVPLLKELGYAGPGELWATAPWRPPWSARG